MQNGVVLKIHINSDGLLVQFWLRLIWNIIKDLYNFGHSTWVYYV